MQKKSTIFLVSTTHSLLQTLPIILKELIFPQNNISIKFYQILN